MDCNTCKSELCDMRGIMDMKCYGYQPKTNADRIRAMSDEELAEFLESTHTNMAIKLGGEYIVRAKEYIGMWLKQPAG